MLTARSGVNGEVKGVIVSAEDAEERVRRQASAWTLSNT